MNKVKTCAAGFTPDEIRHYICYECFFKSVCVIYKKMLRTEIERLQREHDANPAQWRSHWRQSRDANKDGKP